MKKLALGLFCLAGLGFSSDVLVSKMNVQVVNTQQLAKSIEEKSYGWLNSLLSQLNLPSFLKEPIDNFIKSIYAEIMCRIKTPQFSAKVQIPSSVSVPLSCSVVNINFSPVLRQIISNANSLSGGVLDEMHRCLKGDLSACAEVAKKHGYSEKTIENKKAQNDVMFLKGLGQENLSNQSSQQIENEYVKRVNNLSKPAVDTTNPKGAVKNNVVEQGRFSLEKEASTSTGQILNWGKEYTKNFPPQIKPYYNYIANKQLARETIIATLRERIKQERTQLVRLASLVRAWCNKEWNIKTIPPVRGSVGGFLGRANDLREKLEELANKEAKNQKFLENSVFIARARKGLPLLRCCCCDAIPAVHEAKSEVISRIEISTREIETTIRAVGEMLANLISAEQYRTRQQINADAQAIADTLKQTMCLKAQLEYQRNEIMLLQLETQVAELEAIYSQMNEREMTQYKQKVKELRLQY